MRQSAAMLGVVAVLAAFSPANAREVAYRIVQGDTLEAIAGRYLARDRSWRDLAVRNRVGNPRRLIPGATLRLPYQWLRRVPLAARLTSYTGAVEVERGGQGLAAQRGMPLFAPSLVRTGSRSFATVSLPDGSMLSVMPSSTLRLTQLSQVALTGTLLRGFENPQGRVHSTVTPATDPDDSYRVRTPLAVASVRGTSFRTVSEPGTQYSRVEVLEGRVAVAGMGEILLKGGQGAEAAANGMGTPRDLLKAPRLVEPGRLQEGERLTFTLSPEGAAARYHLVVAADAGFVEQLDEVFTEGGEASLPGLSDGIYFVRVSAVSQEGFEGLSRDYSFRREKYSFAAGLEVDGQAGRPVYRFRWQPPPGGQGVFRFQLRRADGPPVPVIDYPGLTEPAITLSAVPPGSYLWKVGRWAEEDGRWVLKWDNEHELVVSR